MEKLASPLRRERPSIVESQNALYVVLFVLQRRRTITLDDDGSGCEEAEHNEDGREIVCAGAIGEAQQQGGTLHL